ncbi:MAG: sigma-70 family RNA polymerase sigma factor, partial [Planctomycetaceae bacterium]|nr:sigma-70 family RNA polymerase sigma factor [Planctomycetaceae bacterium]
ELGRIIENPQAFLLHLAHFVLKECFRNPTRVKYVPDPVSEDPRAWKSQEQTRQQFPDVSAVVADQLSKLTPPLRFMVELVGLRGMEVSDAARLAAEIRKIQPETARSHWYRAKSQLSRSLSTKITHRT